MPGKMYFVVLFALINLSVCKIALRENVELRSQLEPNKTKTGPDDQILETTDLSSMTRPVNEARIQDTRIRRAANSGRRDKCGTSSQCTGNDTLFEKIYGYYNCYCDNACYETFQDCCPDFVKTCGEQKKTNTKNSQPLWKCLAVGGWNTSINCILYGPSGIWMIANCSRNWALDETRTRCENAPKHFSYPVENYLPVVGKNGFTYRNKHCAECNEETSYQSWRISVVEGFTTPPEQYNLDDKLRFATGNGRKTVHIGPGSGMPRRYCAGVRYKDKCLNTSHPAYNDCLNGAVEIVGDWKKGYFKNHACALCNREGTFKDFFSRLLPKPFSTVISAKKQLYPLRSLTLICFSISILFLFLLLVTYWMFIELRTLPGLNLMSLAFSMLLSQVIWLVGTAQFINTKTCEVLGIIEHYLFLVAFMAMSVISYHSCIVFSRPFSRSSNNTQTQFVKYSSMAWISPAIFIAVCVTLDQIEATFDVYGTTCWLSTGKAVLYLFILPAAVIMLFNVVTFIKTALALCKRRDSQILHKNRKQNLIACTKLATLVGFPWLFAFFGVIFPDTEACEYLFVVFVCLQGFYMGVAFVCNKKTLQLYKNWWNTTRAQSSPRDETFEML